jgi:hypothetical protein
MSQVCTTGLSYLQALPPSGMMCMKMKLKVGNHYHKAWYYSEDLFNEDTPMC